MGNMKRIASIFVLTLLLVACKEKQSGGSANLIDRCSVVATREVTGAGDTVVVCDLAKVKEKAILRLSQLVDSLEFIRLESIDTVMVGGENVLNISISDNYIGVNSTHFYKLFTRTGKYITDIGRQGQEPGEYTYVYTSQIDEAHDRVFLLPWTAFGILEYDLRGNFIRKIPLPYMVSKGAMKVDVDNGRITLAKLSWGEDDSPTVWVQDFDGKVLQDDRAAHLDLWPDYSNELESRGVDAGEGDLDFYLFSCLPRVDSLYHYSREENRSVPAFTVDFKGGKLPFRLYYEFANHYMIKMLTDDAMYPDNLDYCLWIDKSTLKGARYEVSAEVWGGVLLPMNYTELSTYHHFIYCMEPGLLWSLLEDKLKQGNAPKEEAAEIRRLLESISENDNNYLLLGRWK